MSYSRRCINRPNELQHSVAQIYRSLSTSTGVQLLPVYNFSAQEKIGATSSKAKKQRHWFYLQPARTRFIPKRSGNSRPGTNHVDPRALFSEKLSECPIESRRSECPNVRGLPCERADFAKVFPATWNLTSVIRDARTYNGATMITVFSPISFDEGPR